MRRKPQTHQSLRRVLSLLLATVMVGGLISGVSNITQPSAATANDMFDTPGAYVSGNRNWRTQPGVKYSRGYRYTTEIWGTGVTYTDNKFVPFQGWLFNNLTYTGMTKSQWGSNPLANTGEWTANGRQWKTICTDTGCRSWIYSKTITAHVLSEGGWGYSWEWKWVYNSQVRFTPYNDDAASWGPTLASCAGEALPPGFAIAASGMV